MKVDPLFDGWWVGKPDRPGRMRHVVQVRAGDEYSLDDVPPQPTREIAESFLYHDSVPGYWKAGMAVYASHCLSCGRWASTVAGDDKGGGWHWQVTECKRCGFVDSRDYVCKLCRPVEDREADRHWCEYQEWHWMTCTCEGKHHR